LCLLFLASLRRGPFVAQRPHAPRITERVFFFSTGITTSGYTNPGFARGVQFFEGRLRKPGPESRNPAPTRREAAGSRRQTMAQVFIIVVARSSGFATFQYGHSSRAAMHNRAQRACATAAFAGDRRWNGATGLDGSFRSPKKRPSMEPFSQSSKGAAPGSTALSQRGLCCRPKRHRRRTV